MKIRDEQIPELSRLLDQVLDLPEAARLDWVAHLRGADAAWAPQLQRLLDPTSDELWLNSPHVWSQGLPPRVGDLTGAAWAAVPLAEFGTGQRIGPYTLERELGRGGMGVVWLAARSDGAYQRRVALKLPHRHTRLFERSHSRFQRERDILAGLAHPNIAQFLDAGIDDHGQPYLALEWVDGLPITTFCRERRASLSERLQLIRQVVAAVDHAHGRLIVHRDLKPENVLVTAAGRVQLLDFGIAKLLETAEGDPLMPLTREGESIATPEYAAPEQLMAGPITVATDIYAIGILLFELLTGRRPATQGAWASFSGHPTPHEIPLASHSLASGHGPQTGFPNDLLLARALAGDLDALLAKTLAFAPEERYGSAEALAGDLERFASGEPLRVRAISRWVRWGKFARRHRVGVGLGAALALAITTGVVGVVWQSAATAREAGRAEATKNFLVGIFADTDPRFPSDRPRGEIPAREWIDLAAARIDRELEADWQTRLELLDLVATIYLYLDELPRAQGLVDQQIAVARQELPAKHPDLMDALLLRIWISLQAGQDAKTAAYLDELDAYLHQHGLDGSRYRAEYFLALGDQALARGDWAGRESALRQAAGLFEAVAPDEVGYADALANLGSLAFGREDFSTALAHYDRALRVPATSHQTTLSRARIQGRRGRVLTELQRFAEAEAAFQEAQATFARTLGLDHPAAWPAIAGLAFLRCQQGNFGEAAALFASLSSGSDQHSLPPPPDQRSRQAETALLRGLCLAHRIPPDSAWPILEKALADLGQQAEPSPDRRRAERLLAARQNGSPAN